MISFENLFKNHFDNKDINDNKLKVFAQDHIQRLSVNNADNVFDTILAETRTAYNDYFGSINQEDSTVAARISSTLAFNKILSEFKELIRRHEGLIRSKYGKKSAAYIEFFPSGITEYNKANKRNGEMLITRFANAVDEHQADLGTDLLNSITTLKNNYNTARGSQLGQKASLSNKKVMTANNRTKIELQLCRNLYTIAAHYPGNIGKCMSFFDQSILKPHHNSARDGLGFANGKITANGLPVANAMIRYEGLKLPASRSKTDGSFKTRNVAIGVHKLQVSAPGYKVFSGTVIIKDAENTVINVEMESE